MQAAIKFSALALSEPHPGAAVLVGELDQWCLVSCGSVDRIGFVLLNLGPHASPENYLACTVARGTPLLRAAS